MFVKGQSNLRRNVLKGRRRRRNEFYILPTNKMTRFVFNQIRAHKKSANGTLMLQEVCFTCNYMYTRYTLHYINTAAQNNCVERMESFQFRYIVGIWNTLKVLRKQDH